MIKDKVISTSNTIKRDLSSPNQNKGVYNEILKPFTPRVRQLTKSSEKYKTFLQSFSSIRGVRAKRMHKHLLISIIEGIYSARFAEEQNTFKMNIAENNNIEISKTSEIPFSKFISNYIETKWKSLRTSSQVFIDCI